MADASAHDEQMENLMGAEVLVAGIEEGEEMGVDAPERSHYNGVAFQ